MAELTIPDALVLELQEIFQGIEQEYDRVARKLSFNCSGCPDNCCDSYFLHHTYVEWAFLWLGFKGLQPYKQQEVLKRSATAILECDQASQKDSRPQVMCPLNEGGRCTLYSYRPLVCRTHGVPASIAKPDGQRLTFSGCFRCQEIVGGLGAQGSDIPLMDRTHFLHRLARLENVLLKHGRQHYPKVRLSIAEMLVKGSPTLLHTEPPQEQEMTSVICFKCGCGKLKIFSVCGQCGAIPTTYGERSQSLVLSHVLSSPAQLVQFASEIKSGRSFSAPESLYIKSREMLRAPQLIEKLGGIEIHSAPAIAPPTTIQGAIICFKCGFGKLKVFAKCGQCGAIPTTYGERSQSLVLSGYLSSTTQLSLFASTIRSGQGFAAPESLYIKSRELMNNVQFMTKHVECNAPEVPNKAQHVSTPSKVTIKIEPAASTNRIMRAPKITTLHRNAFYLLGATTRDNKAKIFELAEEKLLDIDQEACLKARSDLTSSRLRLGVEMAWLPGVSPRRAAQLSSQVLQEPMSIRKESGLPALAFANLMATAFETTEANHNVKDLSVFIKEISNIAGQISINELIRDINEDRSISGFSEIKAVDQVEGELTERTRYFKNTIIDALKCLPFLSFVEVMTLTVDDSTAGGEFHAPQLIDELVDSYELECQSLLEKEGENLQKLIKTIRDSAQSSGESSIKPLVDKLEIVTRNWDKVAQPIQLSAKARGIEHTMSNEQAYSIRQLAIDLFNEHDMLVQSKRITGLIRELFSELPEISERVEQDVEALEDIAIQKEVRVIQELIKSIHDAAKHGDKVIRPKINHLEATIRDWDKAARLLRMRSQEQGVDHEPSKELAYSIRSLAISLFNENDMLAHSKWLLNFIQELFSEFPEVLELVQQDNEALENITLQKDMRVIQELIESIPNTVNRGERLVSLRIDQIETATRDWNKAAKPLRMSSSARGIDHEPSKELAYSIRSLAIDLFNNHDMVAQSKRLLNFIQENFVGLPEISKMIQQDLEALQEIFQSRKQNDVRRDEWEREITYSAEIGIAFKNTLSVSPDGITWKNQRYSLDSITRVRWGGVKNSVNGISTGTIYTLAFGDKRTETVVTLRRREVYSTFVDKLWRAVCVRMLTETVESIKNGQVVSIGDAAIQNESITLTKHKLLGSNERIQCGWSQIQFWNADGFFYLGAKDDKKTYSALSYIQTSNTHILEQLIRIAFKKPGMRKLSEAF